MGAAAIDPVQALVKARLNAAVHLIVAGMGKAVQRKAHRGEDAEHPGAVASVFQPQRPALAGEIGRYKNSPFRPNAVLAGFQRRLTDGVSASVVLHALTQWRLADVPAAAALLIPEIDIAGSVPVEHTHIRFFIQISVAPVPGLGDLGAIAQVVPEIVVPVARCLGVVDDTCTVFGKFIQGLAEGPDFLRHISPRS